jgi:2-oxoglutarate ferredoxin oxidoreductase subunit beta
MHMVVMLFDNAIYGLTKKQTSPTSPEGLATNTHPEGAWLPPLNPLTATLGFSNVSFVAQTVDWNPIHLHATLLRAYKHRGLSFVRIIQRCPQYTPKVFEELQKDPSRTLLLTHERGVPANDALVRMYKNRQQHDPSQMATARELAERRDMLPIGLLYVDESRPCYDQYTARGLDLTDEQKLAELNAELDRFAL